MGAYLRLIDSCITQLKAQGPSRTCNESTEEERTHVDVLLLRTRLLRILDNLRILSSLRGPLRLRVRVGLGVGADSQFSARKVDVRLPGKGNSNSHGAKPVHLIITMIKWIRTSKLSIKNSLSSVVCVRCSYSTVVLSLGAWMRRFLNLGMWILRLLNLRWWMLGLPGYISGQYLGISRSILPGYISALLNLRSWVAGWASKPVPAK